MKDKGVRMKDLLPLSLKFHGGAVGSLSRFYREPHSQSRNYLVFYPMSLILNQRKNEKAFTHRFIWLRHGGPWAV